MPVGSVVNAIAILRHLATAGAPLGVSAIARSLDLGASTCFNILKTLVEEDFVAFDPATKRYRLGSAPAQLFRASASDRLLLAVRNDLEALAAEFHLVCGLWEVRGTRFFLEQVIETDLPTRIHIAPGQRLPRYIGAIGRCAAAADDLERADVARAIHGLRWQQQPGIESYLAEMGRARSRGWAMDEGFYMRGVQTVGAPIVDADGSLRFCLTATMFLGQHPADLVDHVGDSLAAIAQDASDVLAERPPRRAAVERNAEQRL